MIANMRRVFRVRCQLSLTEPIPKIIDCLGKNNLRKEFQDSDKLLRSLLVDPESQVLRGE